jgi:hypothetical protein
MAVWIFFSKTSSGEGVGSGVGLLVAPSWTAPGKVMVTNEFALLNPAASSEELWTGVTLFEVGWLELTRLPPLTSFA